jgi:multidrug resistance efflux pump
MSETTPKSRQEQPRLGEPALSRLALPAAVARPRRGRRALAGVLTLLALAVAAGLGWAAWQAYAAAPWTRDGQVRVYVVRLAPEVSGQVTALLVHDNQFVHRGDLLLRIDARDYAVALAAAKSRLDQAKTDMDNKRSEAQRRALLSDLSTSTEERQTYDAVAQGARAALEGAMAGLAQARVNLERTEIRAPVNGWVTNLLIQRGDYAVAGQRALSLINADSFWVDGYFEETNLAGIHDGDPARVWLMGYARVLHGTVEGIARGITVGNAAPGETGLATVNPVFTWVRLAQRVPVRIRLDDVPPGIRLVQGMTASVQVDPPDPAHPPPRPPAAPAAPAGPTP